ncbi:MULTISPECIES: hypothetical protein [Bacillales]|uniref:hypothetical protein n=1 Tax=Bacillales TaxID=1385 RepID=UPI001CFC2ADD|nr:MULTISPECIES: hypothetical protein [Bacillales]MCP1178580.1 hypothetical protein [Bacillus sp. 1663tsa1]MCP1281791.1 hypothetical protein [Bacillus sp. S0635]MCQ6346543.1 hypothetical protein [Bacillus cereus]MCU5462726.1 hypothetical protein [Bacillus cereus]MCU5750574.1 hypothetical protein [Bacillus cereus]
MESLKRCIRIFLFIIIMSIIWFTLQETIEVTLNYQIYDLLIGAVCFTIVYLFYDKLRLR